MAAGKPTQTIPMQLQVDPPDTPGQFTWLILYRDQATDSLPYLLKPVDPAKGHWVIDERNGILPDSYRISG